MNRYIYPHAVLLVTPSHFGRDNNRIAPIKDVNNAVSDLPSQEEVSAHAYKEVKNLIDVLRNNAVEVIDIEDRPEDCLKSSLFPSSWIAFCPNSQVVAFPMQDVNRRKERRGDILQLIIDKGFPIYDIVDISAQENRAHYLQGTESVVIDHTYKTLYVVTGEVAHEDAAKQLAERMGYTLVLLEASYPYISTLLLLADSFALVCMEAFSSHSQEQLKDYLQRTKREIIEVDTKQVQKFVCSGLQIQTQKGTPVLLLSQTAQMALTSKQKERIAVHGSLLIDVSLNTIEQVSGASVASLIAPIYLPK